MLILNIVNFLLLKHTYTTMHTYVPTHQRSKSGRFLISERVIRIRRFFSTCYIPTPSGQRSFFFVEIRQVYIDTMQMQILHFLAVVDVLLVATVCSINNDCFKKSCVQCVCPPNNSLVDTLGKSTCIVSFNKM